MEEMQSTLQTYKYIIIYRSHISHDHAGSHPVIKHVIHDEGGLHGDDALPQLLLLRGAPGVGGEGVVQVLGYTKV